MSRYWPWLVGLIGLLAVWVSIPKHQVSFPFNCPGICFRMPGSAQGFEQEIKTHLGLDLQGGVQLVMQLRPDRLPGGGTTVPLSDLNTQARGVIDRRINALGVAEPVIQAMGDDKILLELPGVRDLAQAQEIATRQAFLEFKVPDREKPGEFRSLEPPLTGANLNPTSVGFGGAAANIPHVRFSFKQPDADRWVQLSKDFEKQRVQITLDGREISSPTITQVFTSGDGIIEGGFTTESARELSLLLNSGALPVPLEIIQSSRVEPTLGRDSVQKSLIAGVVGLLLVALFMIGYYRIPGAIAVLALLYYTVLVYAIFRLVPVTLTLAGIAGFILSIGMAVDANVLIFERLREELRAGKSLRAAIEEGRARAFPSIGYANLATIVTAVILFYLGTGTVKGFALTLGIGVVVSFFSAIVVTQLLLRATLSVPALRRRSLFGVADSDVERARQVRSAGSVGA